MFIKRLRNETILAYISLLCMLFIKYYESILYYRSFNGFYELMHQQISIPCFYFFLSASILTFFAKQKELRFPSTIYKFSSCFVVVIIIVYTLLILLKILKILTLPFIHFLSIYSILFSICGCIFAIAIYKSKTQ